MKIKIPATDIGRWREHVRKQIASGLSRAAYCRQHGVSGSRLVYWHARLAKAGLLDVTAPTANRFATVELVPAASALSPRPFGGTAPSSTPAAGSIRLVGGGVTADCPVTTDPRQLTELVRTLKEA